MEDIATTGDCGQGQCLAGAEAGAEVGDGGVGGEAAVGQFQEPDAPGVGVAVLLLTQQVTECGCRIDAHEDRPSGLKDRVVGADTDAGQVVRTVDLRSRRDGRVDDVVDGAQGELGVEEVGQQRDHSAVRAVTDHDQRQDQLTEPRLGDRQGEQDVIGRPRRVEGAVEGLLGGVGWLIEELPADLMLPSQVGDGLGSGGDLKGQLLALPGPELLGRAGCRSRQRDRVALRGGDEAKSLSTSQILAVERVAGDGELKHFSENDLCSLHLSRRDLCASPPAP